ncbi:MAG: hypothetical protein HY014_06835 [Acidobacteria bacterium]|nr:hypothetical protein [Acidobacteriota bacterium]MBI3487866.1 hypothetical protein [Acidobacteriota bacterium]
MDRRTLTSAILSCAFAGVLGLLTACGGGSSTPPGPATKLHYTNPPASGFRLEVDPATNDTPHLVLNLVGPAGTTGQGAALFLTCDATKAVWASPGGADPFAKAGGALTLGPVALFKSKRQGAGDLEVGICQTGAPAANLGKAPIVSLALDLKPDGGLLSGTAVALAPTTGKASKYLDAQMADQPMALGVGTLTAQ